MVHFLAFLWMHPCTSCPAILQHMEYSASMGRRLVWGILPVVEVKGCAVDATPEIERSRSAVNCHKGMHRLKASTALMGNSITVIMHGSGKWGPLPAVETSFCCKKHGWQVFTEQTMRKDRGVK